MKILHIIPSLGNGGAEKFVIDLTNEHAKNHVTFLVSFKDINDSMFFIKNISSKVNFITLNKKNGFDIIFLFRLINFIKNERPDIVNTHLSSINYFFPIIILFNRIRYFHTIHTISNIEEKRKFFRFIRQIYFKFHLIKPVCLTKEIKNSFDHIYNNYESVIILNGIKAIEKTSNYEEVFQEIKRYQIDQQTKVFLVVARFSEEKNLLMLTKVFKKLFEEKRDVILLMIGEDPSKDKNLWNEVLTFKAENTFLLGPKPNVSDYVICSDALCLSSIYEGMPITIIEAYSAGIPVISTPAGGIPDILVDNENGILSSDFQEKSFYTAIDRYLKLHDVDIEKIKRKNKLDFIEKYSITIASNKYENLYFSKMEEIK